METKKLQCVISKETMSIIEKSKEEYKKKYKKSISFGQAIDLLLEKKSSDLLTDKIISEKIIHQREMIDKKPWYKKFF